MAELKTVSAPVREQFAKGYKPAGVGVKTRRQLKQDRSRLASQQRQAVFEQFEAVDRARDFEERLPDVDGVSRDGSVE